MKMKGQNKYYIAMIADIKSSKQLKNRGDVQEQLKGVLKRINEEYVKDIAADFVITLGDEFQGLLQTGEHIMYIIQEIEQLMHPVKLRFGIGIGEITTEIDRTMALGADGPGYYFARDAITQVKNKENRKQTATTSIQIQTDSVNMELIHMINIMLSLLEAIKEEWSDRQREIIWDMLMHEESQSAVAKKQGITQPTVQKALAKSKFYVYKDTIDSIDKALKEIGQHV